MAQIAAQNVLMNCNIVIQEGSGILDNKHFLSLDKSEKLQDSFYSPKESKTRGFTDSMMNKERQDYASAEHAAAKAQREQEENMFYRQHLSTPGHSGNESVQNNQRTQIQNGVLVIK